MKKIHEVLQIDVWKHWMKVENFTNFNFRSDIRNPLPKDLTWYLAEIEEEDLNQLFIISSGDWADISDGTFRVLDVVSRLNLRSDNPDTQRIANDIHKKVEFLNTGRKLDTQLIAVTNSPDLDGPFTIIEGNRCSVALCVCTAIVGCQIFIGTSSDIINYKWAKKSYFI